MRHVFLEQVATWLLVLHALAAIVATAAATHHAVLAVRGLRGRSVPWRLVRLYVRVLLWSLVVTLILGFGVYPAFRVYVRAAWMDRAAPAATGFFEIKEHWSTIAFVGVLYLWTMGREVTRKSAGERVGRTYFVVALIVAATLWFTFLTGLSLVPMRSV